jgi:SNF2 family DNA or RNA helicase
MNEVYLDFSPEERDLYKAVEERARVTVNKYLKAKDALKNYSSILAMIVRLRQVDSVLLVLQ